MLEVVEDRLARARDYVFLSAVASVIVALDQWTKYLVRSRLEVGEIWDALVPGTLDFPDAKVLVLSTPRWTSRVTPAVAWTRALRPRVSRLNRVDLPTFGRPTRTMVGFNAGCLDQVWSRAGAPCRERYGRCKRRAPSRGRCVTAR